jgi:branched-chain amino acid transport system permease protein
VHFGYTGLLNFGQAGFLAMGAYGAAITVEHFHQSLWLGIVVGILAAVLFALVLGLPTLRLRADYLAIVTIAAAEIIRLCMRSVTFGKVTGGSSGINGYTSDFYDLNPFGTGTYGIGPVHFSELRFFVLLVGWSLVVLTSFGVFLLMRSPWGRVVKSIREDENAARSLGKNVYSYKMQSLIVGGVIGALGGIISALATQSVQPDNFGTQITFLAYAALILGGTATIIGPIVGSMLLWALLTFTDTFLRQALTNDLIPTSIIRTTDIGAVRFILAGVMLVLLMVFRPQGIFGNRREIDLSGR